MRMEKPTENTELSYYFEGSMNYILSTYKNDSNMILLKNMVQVTLKLLQIEVKIL